MKTWIMGRGLTPFAGAAVFVTWTSLLPFLPPAADAQVYARPTYSSPIALSRDDRFVWVVNPDDDSVSVIRSDNNTRIAKITVGDEPQSIALTPDGFFAYVANAAGGSVSVIQIQNTNYAGFAASVVTHILTGAEPWNIVTSPDGLRVFVANSAQDTITVLNAVNRGVIGHVNLRDSIANDPDRSRPFQPRGLAVTGGNTKLYVTRFLSFTKAGGRQGDDFGKEVEHVSIPWTGRGSGWDNQDPSRWKRKRNDGTLMKPSSGTP